MVYSNGIYKAQTDGAAVTEDADGNSSDNETEPENKAPEASTEGDKGSNGSIDTEKEGEETGSEPEALEQSAPSESESINGEDGAKGTRAGAEIIASGTCGTNLTWTLDSEGLLTISGNGSMANFSQASDAPWYGKRTSIITVNIDEGVTSIGNYAFYDCTNLTSITLPDSVTSIGYQTFYGCSGLTSIAIPEGVTSIESGTFYGCSSLTSIAIPEGVTSIGSELFRNCSGLASIVIPDSVTSIGYQTFYGCSSLTNIAIPEGVTSIGNDVFRNCSGLTSIVIPDSVTSIGYQTFYGCSSLTSIAIPEGVTSIENGTFYGCSSLTSITIPEGVTSIGQQAFYGCSNLTSIVIPDSVTSIGSEVFRNCSSLTSIVLPDSVTSIEGYAFHGCSGLTSIAIPEGVTSIGTGAFNGCSSLTSIAIPEGVTSIGTGAFHGCSNLTSIVLPDSVTSIGSGVFRNCSSLTSIVLPDSVTSIGEYAFDNCSSLTSIAIPEGVTSIGQYAFLGCSSLTSIAIPEGVTSIGYSAFSGIDNNYIVYTTPNSYASTFFAPSHIRYLCEDSGEISDSYLGFKSDRIIVPVGDAVVLGDYVITSEDLSAYSVDVSDGDTFMYSNGQIAAFGEGSCNVTITSGDRSATARLIASNGSVAASSLSLADPSITMHRGDKIIEPVTIGPANATSADITWTSSNDSVVTVTDGLIAAVSPGTATITAALTSDPGINATCDITVISPLQAIVTLEDAVPYTIEKGTSKKFSYYIYPSDASDFAPTYTSSDPQIISIDSNGKMTAHQNGTVQITISSGEMSKTVDVTAYTALTGISLDKTSVTASPEDEIQLTVIYEPEGATGDVTWTSNNEACATVDGNGLVTIHSTGIAKITAQCGEYTATCNFLCRAHTHTWDEGIVTAEPSCTETGLMTYTCTSCGATRTETIEALGHDFSEWEVTHEATAAEEGEESRTCSRCGEVETRPIAKLPAAMIGETAYPTLQAAVDAAEEGDTIILAADISENISIPSGKTVTLDLNGNTLTSASDDETIYNAGTLVINDEIGSGSIEAISEGDDAIRNRGSITINSGTIVGALMSNGSRSTVTITGGSLMGTIAASNPGVVQITGGTFSYDVSGYLDSDHMAVREGDVYVIANVVRVTVQSMDKDSYAEVATVSGGGAYAQGSDVTVKASSVSGYDFVGWYAKDGSGYSGSVKSTKGTYTFTADEDIDLIAVYKVSAAGGTAELQVNGSDFRVNGGAIQKINNYRQTFDLNTEITLEATGEDFLYWMNSSNKIVSTGSTYTFTLVRTTSVTPVYKRAAESTAYVEFVSDYDQIIQAQNYGADSSVTMPNGPSKSGYIFVSWDKTADEIRTAISEGETYIRVKPVYEIMSGTFSLTLVYDGAAEEPEQLAGYQQYRLTAKEIEGKQFAYWQDDLGNKLSTNSSYKYLLNRDVTIYAVYVNEGETVTEEPLIAITNVSGVVDSGTNKIQYTVIRDVPEGYTVVENGVVYSAQSAYGEEGGADLLLLGRDDVRTSKSSNNNRYGIYAFTFNVGSRVDTPLYLKGYMTVKNDATGETETIYTDMVSKTFNEAK